MTLVILRGGSEARKLPSVLVLVLCWNVFILSGCATMSPEAARLVTIRDGAVTAMKNCKQLGFVTGDAGIWGGAAGLDSALVDAKNKAALIPGANAMIVTSSRMNPSAVVNATVFNCSEQKTQQSEQTNPDSTASSTSLPLSDETLRKAKACQDRGGVWVNDQCILDID